MFASLNPKNRKKGYPGTHLESAALVSIIRLESMNKRENKQRPRRLPSYGCVVTEIPVVITVLVRVIICGAVCVTCGKARQSFMNLPAEASPTAGCRGWG